MLVAYSGNRQTSQQILTGPSIPVPNVGVPDSKCMYQASILRCASSRNINPFSSKHSCRSLPLKDSAVTLFVVFPAFICVYIHLSSFSCKSLGYSCWRQFFFPVFLQHCFVEVEIGNQLLQSFQLAHVLQLEEEILSYFLCHLIRWTSST